MPQPDEAAWRPGASAGQRQGSWNHDLMFSGSDSRLASMRVLQRHALVIATAFLMVLPAAAAGPVAA